MVEELQSSHLRKTGPNKSAVAHFCKSHPGSEANWRCLDCGNEFCERCVRPVKHLNLGDTRSAVCIECRGQCIDFKSESEKIAEIKEKELKARRNTVIRYAAFSLLLLPFLFDVLRWLEPQFSTEIKFFLAALAAFWLGPLRKIDLAYKLGAILFLAALANPLLAAATVMGNAFLGDTFSSAGQLIFQTPVKYLAESILAFTGFFIVEKISYCISGLYYGRSHPTKERIGRRGRVLITASIATIIFSLVYGLIKLIEMIQR